MITKRLRFARQLFLWEVEIYIAHSVNKCITNPQIILQWTFIVFWFVFSQYFIIIILYSIGHYSFMTRTKLLFNIFKGI